jgi:hypothetical protein
VTFLFIPSSSRHAPTPCHAVLNRYKQHVGI